ncbi:MAG: methionine adenosyltransferase [Planctomycetes bacterium]|nr:methionine adenosyltransferase [Planctomycetota bacterium]
MGHPDKVCDQISDAILDSLLEHDPHARCAVETLVTTGLVTCAGEVRTSVDAAEKALANAETTIRNTIKKIGYDDPAGGFDHRSCAVLRAIHSQSADIAQGVDAGSGLHVEQGAGDQGLMFGFACRETKPLMPLPIHLSHRLVEQLAQARLSGDIKWLRPDSKSQVTCEYNRDNSVARIETIVISTQHTDEVTGDDGNMLDSARKTIIEQVIKPVVDRETEGLWSDSIKFHINPTGRFVVGGPHGDAGLTGRKIIVDTYGGRGRHGGGAFSGKDPTKVDRSAAYMCRNIAKSIVAAGLADQAEVQLAYAIGVAEPVSVRAEMFGTGKVDDEKMSEAIRDTFDLTPAGIINGLNLLRPIYFETARHGHFGRELPDFTWEATPQADALRSALA